MKTIEKMAEEYLEKHYIGISNPLKLELERKAFMFGWRACREAIVKRLEGRWLVTTAEIKSFGEEDSVPETAESETQKD